MDGRGLNTKLHNALKLSWPAGGDDVPAAGAGVPAVPKP